MNKSILNLVTKANLGGTGDLRAFYGFGGGFGTKIIFNDLYTTGEQFSGIHPLIEKMPAISVGSTDSPTAVSDSGRFIGTDVIEIAGQTPTGNWTFYIDYLKEEVNRTKSCVLVSTMDTPVASSGFNFGVNGANHPYFEFKDSNGVLKTFTHQSSVNKEALISVSKNSDTVEVVVHDKPNRSNQLAKFDVSGYQDSSSWFIGGPEKVNPTTFNSDPNYERLSGYIDSFVLYDGAQVLSTKNSISDSFFYSSYASGGLIQKVASGLITTGVVYNPTGITGTGITGYVNVLKETINTITIYGKSGVSGALTGAAVSLLRGTGYITGVSTENSGVSISYNNSRLKQHGADSIIFTKSLNQQDIFEVRSFNQIQSGDNLQGQYRGFQNSYYTDSGYSGGTENINVFLGGTGQYSGTEYNVLNGSFINFTGMKVVTGVDEAPSFIYDKTTGNQNVSAFTGSLGTITFTEDDFFGRDVFFSSGNGGVFGRKLLSGLEWSGFSNRIEIAGSGLGSGKFFFMPMVSESFDRATGVPQTYNKLSFPLLNEQVWLNGLRQVKGVDYITSSKLSLLNSNNRISGFKDPLYEDTDDFFNI